MRHESWNTLVKLLDEIAGLYGGSVWDSRCKRTWDPGQAVCAEAYGPDWGNNAEFKAVNALGDEGPVPEAAFFAANRLIRGESDWAAPVKVGKETTDE